MVYQWDEVLKFVKEVGVGNTFTKEEIIENTFLTKRVSLSYLSNLKKAGYLIEIEGVYLVVKDEYKKMSEVWKMKPERSKKVELIKEIFKKLKYETAN